MNKNPKTVASDERILKIILAPHISEKSTLAADNNRQYVFKVLRDATKPEIRVAVEKLFKVNVEKVQVILVKGKTKAFKQRTGTRQNWKKAFVKLKQGQEIKFTDKE